MPMQYIPSKLYDLMKQADLNEKQLASHIGVVSTAIAAYDFRAKYSPAVCSSDLFASRYLGLNHLKFFRWNDRFMGVVLQGEYFAPPSGHKKRSPAIATIIILTVPTAG